MTNQAPLNTAAQELGTDGNIAVQTNLEQIPMENNQHTYFEVANEVMAKPNLLSDILETRTFTHAVVFCGTGSETDLVTAVLKKRGLNVTRLSEELNSSELEAAVEKAQQSPHAILVSDDDNIGKIANQSFDLIFNYSAPKSADAYNLRNAGTKTTITFVSPLDFGNFHTLKKELTAELVKGELPSKESLAHVKVDRLVKEALSSSHLNDETTKAMAEQILTHSCKEQILSFLLNKFLTTTVAAAAPARESRDSRDSDSRYGNRRDNRWDNRRQNDNRDNRQDNRNNNRGENRRGPRDSERNREQYQDQPQDQEQRQSRYGSDRKSWSNNSANNRRNNENSDSENNYERTEVKRDVRFYVGHGEKEGFSQAAFTQLLQKQTSLSQDQIKRFSGRQLYTYVDFPSENCEMIESELAKVKLDDGKTLFFRKATVIPLPKEERQKDSSQQDNENSEFQANSDSNDQAEFAEQEDTHNS